MKKILNLFLAVVLVFGCLQISSFAEKTPPQFATPQPGYDDFEGIDGTYPYNKFGDDNDYRDVYISHPTLMKALKQNSLIRTWATVAGAALGKIPGLGWMASLGVSAVIAFLHTCDANIEDIDEGYGVIVPFVYLDDESGWGPCGAIYPQDEEGCELATDWEGNEEWAYQMFRAGIPLTDLFKL